eukprot:gb/GECH01012345.1/.p1 GENE.gb/GECH01012345.1/~~gb/GECH01012345.1/.p1  ORF type:complete len:187 (+),score=21.16 gb/GECH01012345.1/:1-561(+)
MQNVTNFFQDVYNKSAESLPLPTTRDEPEEELTWWQQKKKDIAESVSLTREQRVMGCLGCIGLGVLCILISLSILPSVVLLPRKFAFLFTIGNVLCIAGVTFLVGIKKQFQSMFDPSRAVSSAIYILSTILSLVIALKVGHVILVICMVIVQLGAFTWYTLSYVPFAQSMLSSMARWTWSLCVNST